MKLDELASLTITTRSRIQRRGLEMIITFICSLLLNEWKKEELRTVDGKLFYLEDNGFANLEDESGSFLVYYRNGSWAINVALTVNELIAFINLPNMKESRCVVVDYYVHTKSDSQLTPFYTTKDYYRFRKQLKSIKANQPIALLNVLRMAQK